MVKNNDNDNNNNNNNNNNILAVSPLQQVIFSGVLNVIILNTDDKKVTGDKFITCTIS